MTALEATGRQYRRMGRKPTNIAINVGPMYTNDFTEKRLR
jgi:hypothetical protein